MEVDLLTFSLIICEFGSTSKNKYRSIEKLATLAVGWMITSENCCFVECYYFCSN